MCSHTDIWRSKDGKTQRRFLGQRVNIVGLGLPLFQEVMNNILAVDQQFARHFREDEFSPLQPWMTEAGPCVTVSNSHFTRCNPCHPLLSVPFSPDVDPRNILQQLAGDVFFHTQDNEVKYYKVASNKDGLKK